MPAASALPEPFRTAAWQDGDDFHARSAAVYRVADAQAEPPELVKREAGMAHVRYLPSHPNPAYADHRGGRGASYSVWLACEQGPQAEGISESVLAGIIDTYLEPGASIGLHRHDDTEETYYLLAGELRVWLEDRDGSQHEWLLAPGDSHRIGRGMSHTSLAGPQGARFVVVMLALPVAETRQ